MISQSGLRTYRKCARRFEFSHVRRMRPVSKPEFFAFGTAWHTVREAYWLKGFDAAVDSIADTGVDEWAQVRLAVMLRGYHAATSAWLSGVEVVGVEVPFVHGELHGVIDAVIRVDGRLWVVEEKTSSSAPGASYLARLEIDPQISIYHDAVTAKYGEAPAGVWYFVVVKPSHEPKKATPVEERKYTKAGALYANQRAEDETLAEYMARLTEVMTEDRFHRFQVSRLEASLEDAREDTAQTMAAVEVSKKLQLWPRNPDACEDRGHMCPYFAVCTRRASLDDATLYRKEESYVDAG
jgi:hypothetical protein